MGLLRKVKGEPLDSEHKGTDDTNSNKTQGDSTIPLGLLRSGEVLEDVGPFKLIVPPTLHPITTDPLLLVDFIFTSQGCRELPSPILDIGTGTGIIPFLIASRCCLEAIVAVDIDPLAAGALRRSVELNNLEGRIEVLESDYRVLTDLYGEGSFPVIVSNPPYIVKGSGRVSKREGRRVQREEVHGSMAELLDCCASLTAGGGRIFLVYPYGRLKELRDECGTRNLTVERVEVVEGSGGEGRIFLAEVGV